jgi:hypothetical protein
MTVSSPNVIEIKLDRLIDDMRFLRSQIIAFDRRLNGIEAYLKSTEPSEQQLQSEQQSGQPCFIWEHDPTIEHCKLKIRSGCNHAPVNAARQSDPICETRAIAPGFPLRGHGRHGAINRPGGYAVVRLDSPASPI